MGHSQPAAKPRNPTASQLRAEANFLARVAAQGGRLAAGAHYVNATTPVDLFCRFDHPCSPIPTNAQRGGICIKCGWGGANAATRFGDMVAERGARFAEGARYTNNKTPVELICSEGHKCSPRPNDIQKGQAICSKCSRKNKRAEAEFLAEVAAQGGRLAEGAAYVEVRQRVQLICKVGHECSPLPKDLQQGGGICSKCSWGLAQAEAEFLAAVALHGGRLAEGAAYVNSATRVAMICRNGHDCRAHPSKVQQGYGICEQCVTVFDRVYLLAHDEAQAIKIGVASGPVRVRGHVARGYRRVAEWRELEHQRVKKTEREVLDHWRSNGWAQVAGAPEEGRTETAVIAHLDRTLTQLKTLLGEPSHA